MRFDKSETLYERARQVTPGGIHSNVRLQSVPVPLFYERGEGAHIYDVDGNEYIDYVLGQGPMLLGYTPKPVLDAVRERLDKGLVYAGQTGLEVRAAELICQMVPCAEMVRFNCTGSEAVHAALRAARAFTGRDKVLRFEGHYHGWFDLIAWNYCVMDPEKQGPRENPSLQPSSLGQPMASAADVIVRPWNDLNLVEDLFKEQGDDIAAVITEPMMCNWGGVLPVDGFLEGLRDLCTRYGAVLIFDEVITGFRLAVGGAQEYFGVTPDLATFAKAMGGGMVVSAVAGRADILKLFGEGDTVHAGTYNSNPLSMAGTVAALEMLVKDDGAELKKAHASGTRLMQGLRDLAKTTGSALTVRGLPPVFQVSFMPDGAAPVVDFRSSLQADVQKGQAFWAALHERGIRTTARNFWFLSTAHSEADVETTLDVAAEALAAVDKE